MSYSEFHYLLEAVITNVEEYRDLFIETSKKKLLSQSETPVRKSIKKQEVELQMYAGKLINILEQT